MDFVLAGHLIPFVRSVRGSAAKVGESKNIKEH
ncbi:hypothetical protein CYA_0783 [Synechococcus sp. JA-3-3Ab]|nr:hypothetical protein CYA_0783 [Synechococcus sp. JA-3-3Ab]